MSDRYEAQEVEPRYWRVIDHLLGDTAIAGYTGNNAAREALKAAAELNLNSWRWENREATEELPEAEQTQPDIPPYYFRVDFIGGHFEAICSLCENPVLVIEHRMSVTTPVTACAAHLCPPAQGGLHG